MTQDFNNRDRDRLDADEQRTLELREEELMARKRQVEAGEVTLRKDVVSEERSVDVPVRHEEVVIERRPVDRQPTDDRIGDDQQTINVPVRGEQVELDKDTRVYEEIGVEKRTIQDTAHVQGTVRREEAVIDSEGDVRRKDE
jgi:uncharacterized protein (TIGR02271 family)